MPLLPRRKDIRLKGYDYSQSGLYFITICVQDRLCLFGKVQGGEMILNDAGRMVERWYNEIERKYPDKRCHNMVVMPNHFHCIIEIVDDADANHHSDAHVGAPLRGRPTNENGRPVNENEQSFNENEQPNNDDIHPDDITDNPNPEKYGMHNIRYGATISDVMDWFKTMTTNEYIRNVRANVRATLRGCPSGCPSECPSECPPECPPEWQPFNRKLWQRNFYEHIIRTPEAYERIADYIDENPAKWNEDKFFNR